jgi:hypothetical protein
MSQGKDLNREDLTELHYIAKINAVPSILRLGILSHNNAANIEHESIANNEVQERRANKKVPGGRRLHDYANLYICARNPMLYVRRTINEELCILQINTDVLDVPDVVITDRNASADFVRFAQSPEGLKIVDKELTFADRWTDSDQTEYFRKKSAKCAEVLVPDCVEPKYIMAAYVSNDNTKEQLRELIPSLSIKVYPYLFFLGGDKHD